MTQAFWPARMQRLKSGPLVTVAPGIELWLDGGHNPAAGEAIAAHLGTLPKRPTYLICGMLNTKDIGGYLRPLAGHAEALYAVSIPGEIEHAACGDDGGGGAQDGACRRDSFRRSSGA